MMLLRFLLETRETSLLVFQHSAPQDAAVWTRRLWWHQATVGSAHGLEGLSTKDVHPGGR